MLQRRALITALAALSAPSVVRAQGKSAIAITAIPGRDESHLVERFGRVAAYLQEKLGLPVASVPVKSYPAAVTAFVNDQVQLAWFGGFTGVQARRAVLGSQAIAQGIEDTNFRSPRLCPYRGPERSGSDPERRF